MALGASYAQSPVQGIASAGRAIGSGAQSAFNGVSSLSGGWGSNIFGGGGGGQTQSPYSPGAFNMAGPGLNQPYGSYAGPGGLYPGQQIGNQQSAIPQNPGSDPLAWQKYFQNMYAGQGGDVTSALQAQKDAQSSQLAQIEGGYGAASSAATQGAALQNQNIDLELQKLGINKDALARQPGLIDQMFGLRQQSGTADRQHLTNMEGFNDQQLQAQLGSAGLNRDTQTQQARSDAVTRGAVTTSGAGQDLKNIQSNYDFTAKNYQSLHDYQNEGIKRSWDNSFFQDQIDKAQTGEQKAQIQDQQKTLDVTAQQFGLQREQIANSLAQTLASSGLSRIMSVGQVTAALNSSNVQLANWAYQLTSKAAADAQTASQMGWQIPNG